MLTPRGLRAFSTLLQFSCRLGILPFRWNMRLYRLEDDRWADLLLTCGVTAVLLTRNVFLFANYQRQDHLSPISKILFVYWILNTSYNSICMTCHIWKRALFKSAVNHFFRQHELMAGEFGQQQQEAPSTRTGVVVELILRYWLLFCAQQGLAFGGFFVVNYSHPWYYYSLLVHQPPGGIGWTAALLLVPFATYEFLEWLFVWNCMGIGFLILMCYWYSLSSWLQHLCEQGDQSPVVAPSTNAITTYRALQTLNGIYGTAFSSTILLFIQIAAVGFAVYLLHLAIRFHDIFPPPFTVALLTSVAMCMIFFTFVYPMAAEVTTRSEKYLSHLKKTGGVDKELQVLLIKQIRASPPLRIRIGSFFHVQRFTSIKSISAILYWTIRTLLMAQAQDSDA